MHKELSRTKCKTLLHQAQLLHYRSCLASSQASNLITRASSCLASTLLSYPSRLACHEKKHRSNKIKKQNISKKKQNKKIQDFSNTRSIKVQTLWCLQPAESLLVSTFILLNKSRYKNKCGGDLLKAHGANSLEISPPTSRTTPTDQLQAACPRQDLVLTVLKCHFHPPTILNNEEKLHALLTYLYH